MTTPQKAFSDASAVLKPTTSCSAPNTSTLFAWRAAAVLGTFAHDCANGAAESVAEDDAVARDADPDAAATNTLVTAAVPGRSHRHLFIRSSSCVSLAGAGTGRWSRTPQSTNPHPTTTEGRVPPSHLPT